MKYHRILKLVQYGPTLRLALPAQAAAELDLLPHDEVLLVIQDGHAWFTKFTKQDAGWLAELKQQGSIPLKTGRHRKAAPDGAGDLFPVPAGAGMQDSAVPPAA